jgi:hypothetical protein
MIVSIDMHHDTSPVSNNCMNLTIMPVTVPGEAGPAPGLPAGYADVRQRALVSCWLAEGQGGEHHARAN